MCFHWGSICSPGFILPLTFFTLPTPVGNIGGYSHPVIALPHSLQSPRSTQVTANSCIVQVTHGLCVSLTAALELFCVHDRNHLHWCGACMRHLHQWKKLSHSTDMPCIGDSRMRFPSSELTVLVFSMIGSFICHLLVSRHLGLV